MYVDLGKQTRSVNGESLVTMTEEDGGGVREEQAGTRLTTGFFKDYQLGPRLVGDDAVVSSSLSPPTCSLSSALLAQ